MSEGTQALRARQERRIGVFVCANCARRAIAPSSALRPAPETPDFGWPFAHWETIVPCAGRVQPEHVLKCFEAGVLGVCVVACGADNCHTLDGSPRCRRRVDFLRRLLDEIGLGAHRLMFFDLPGSAAEDMAATDGTWSSEPPGGRPGLLREISVIRAEVIARAAALPDTPLERRPWLPNTAPETGRSR